MVILDNTVQEQINQCIKLLKNILDKELLGIYLYGSAVVGGLQKFSDIDLFVVSQRSTTDNEKEKLIKNLLLISGDYQKNTKLPVELTIVVKSDINPWQYPPKFDFQYGDWLRSEFENGNMNPWPSKVMPDLALLITQIHLASVTLWGLSPNQLLCPVPYRDLILAMKASLNSLNAELESDTRNVLLTYARIWSLLETNMIHSKPAAALWAIDHLPKEFQIVLQRARSFCMGELSERWDEIEFIIQPCANFMVNEINKRIILIENSGYISRAINLVSNV